MKRIPRVGRVFGPIGKKSTANRWVHNAKKSGYTARINKCYMVTVKPKAK